MNILFSKHFRKDTKRYSGKIKESIRDVIQEVLDAKSLNEITDCKKIVGFENIYRIRIGNLRAFFCFYVEIKEGTVYFLSLLPRGEAYDKKTQQFLRNQDN